MLEHLLHEEGVALGLTEDDLDERLGRRLAAEGAEHGGDSVLGQPLDGDAVGEALAQ